MGKNPATVTNMDKYPTTVPDTYVQYKYPTTLQDMFLTTVQGLDI
jgi:hypothetical protein